ncbi:uncharacterized protein L969DRAFT_43414 [Mixia osmundae IAM 14324]|uniref:Uncharacterized protein n=1 Tax=Mixia osmundae (strain CBS 9802 / IAM 14324 / JCM 22182 / KY 12970) TaxID=764103 RepID=G7DV91_MIXOS|nr:uncharacterized protein L969DRAFT_43414 [Mixia osmundae IAM 14324]KEI42076.1 hypothetical protein L969DRAFT_43414 [Mixia osmundae IAM 14324]GAA94501.1 hypothetical protein E5Q_01153 [Mixia osmundae IAM 14324]
MHHIYVHIEKAATEAAFCLRGFIRTTVVQRGHIGFAILGMSWSTVVEVRR